MIRLYGTRRSNYYNIVKIVLMEKGMRFEEVAVQPSQDTEFLAKSPMGKVPCIETAEGFLTETSVIIDYLDDLGVGASFYPADPFQRAKVRELMAHIELYLELQARRLYGDVFFGRPASDEEKALVRPLLEKGFHALAKLARYQPFIAGESITYADFYFRFAVGPALVVCRKALDWDVFNEVPEIRKLINLIDRRPLVQQLLAEQQQELSGQAARR